MVPAAAAVDAFLAGGSGGGHGEHLATGRTGERMAATERCRQGSPVGTTGQDVPSLAGRLVSAAFERGPGVPTTRRATLGVARLELAAPRMDARASATRPSGRSVHPSAFPRGHARP